MQDKANLKRREFMKNTGKLLASAGFLSTVGSGQVFGANSNKTNKNQTWLITGASGGLGFELAKYLLDKGDKVALTSRKIANLQNKFGKENENMLFLELRFDSNLNAQIKENLKIIKDKFTHLDNLVNNAGYGLLGFVEEISEKDLREQFEVNLFAPFLLTQEALKIMRSQSKNKENIRARIFNMSSIAGFRVPMASSAYSMSKFALSALSEGLNLELKDFNIACINVMPAGFRTEFLGTSLKFADAKIADYDVKREVNWQNAKNFNGKQAGNPKEFAKVIYQISRQKEPPLYLFMGDAAYKSAKNKIASVESDMKKTQSYAGVAVDFKDSSRVAFDKR